MLSYLDEKIIDNNRSKKSNVLRNKEITLITLFKITYEWMTFLP